jgi:hypothetical protein
MSRANGAALRAVGGREDRKKQAPLDRGVLFLSIFTPTRRRPKAGAPLALSSARLCVNSAALR